MLIQAPSMREVVRRARSFGRRTVVGGPAPSTAPREFAEADVVFGGEAEGRVAELIAAIEGRAVSPGDKGCQAAGQTLVPLRKESRPDVKSSPVPRFDLLVMDAYTTMSIQYSRGCPYRCEFCDIIEIFGRVPRLKTPAQMLAELETLRALGWRGSVFVVDDNFIGNVRELRKLLPELRGWQEAHGWPFDFYTEASVNLAGHRGLVSDMAACGFTGVFLGIETPSPAALAETKKTQNLDLDLGQVVDGLTRAGFEVMAGFIVGFDSDDASASDAQRAFLQDAPIPLAMVGLLTALPHSLDSIYDDAAPTSIAPRYPNGDLGCAPAHSGSSRGPSGGWVSRARAAGCSGRWSGWRCGAHRGTCPGRSKRRSRASISSGTRRRMSCLACGGRSMTSVPSVRRIGGWGYGFTNRMSSKRISTVQVPVPLEAELTCH
jgi:hypothetical protein